MNAEAVIVGAGPAGAEAALTLAAAGVDVALIDENPAAGGQIWRRRFDGGGETGEGVALRELLAASAVRMMPGTRVWHLEPAKRGFTADLLANGEAQRLTSRVLILATGARERVVPCPGWTLPGVIGLAGATALLKGQGVAPGSVTLVAGSGPLLYALAAALLDRGVSVPAVVDLARRRDWLRASAGMAARPALLATGARWMGRIARARVPMLFGHAVRSLAGEDRVARATVGPVNERHQPIVGHERGFAVDSVCIGHGLAPSVEAAALLGAALAFGADDATWRLAADGDGATNIPGLFVAGDGVGIAGAAAASLSGRLAAQAALRLLRPGAVAADAALRRRRDAAARFGEATAALSAPRPGAYTALTPETIACRCESVTVAALDRALGEGAATIGALKGATRAGMGPCGGRMCADTLAARLALGRGCALGDVAPGVARSPLRPVPLAAVAAGFDYAELPPLAPSPL